MYCPTCELETEGEAQTECAICESLLVESRAEVDGLERAASEEEMNSQEMIQKIDQTVETHLDDTGEIELQGSEPQDPNLAEGEFTAEQDAPGDDVQSGQSGKSASDLEGPVPDTEGLGQPLDGTDADEEPTDSSVRVFSSKRLLYVAVLVIALIATGAYYSFVHRSEPAPQQKVTAPKAQDRVWVAVREMDVDKSIQHRVVPTAKTPKASVARTVPLKEAAAANHAIGGIPTDPAVASRMPVRKAAGTVRPMQERPVRKPAAAAVGPTVPREQVARNALTDQPTARIKKQKAVEAEPRVVPVGYRSIQAGSFRTGDSAGRVVSELRKLGFDAYVEKADLGAKGVWYRVKIGEFRTMKEAELKQSELRKVVGADTWIVTKRE